jgi:hypothetical protein
MVRSERVVNYASAGESANLSGRSIKSGWPSWSRGHCGKDVMRRSLLRLKHVQAFLSDTPMQRLGLCSNATGVPVQRRRSGRLGSDRDVNCSEELFLLRRQAYA